VYGISIPLGTAYSVAKAKQFSITLCGAFSPIFFLKSTKSSAYMLRVLIISSVYAKHMLRQQRKVVVKVC
jgi:hypothetical protein